MEKRVKIIHWLTAIALIALVIIQGYWLFNQYIYVLQQYESELYRKTIDAAVADKALRKELQNKGLYTMTRWEMNVMQNPAASNSDVDWKLYAYIIDKNEITSVESLSIQQIDSLCTTGNGIEKYKFDVKAPHGEYDIYNALERFQINKLCPFTTARFDSLLHAQGMKHLSVRAEAMDSILWSPQKINYTSIWKPIMEVIYPFDILGKEQVRVTYELGISPVLGRMLESLIGSIILSFLLVFCLIYQTKTIFKQRKIDELRKDFIKTMIHELKRPVATLKMCISFMKNDKMMNDKAMKEDILRSSQNGLDNLSSYFSKLRDLAYGDLEEIPLNLSTFALNEVIDECINKQNLPTDRQINIKTYFDTGTTEITADRMHIANIFCNLLENAVKYSEGETTILIDCRSVGGKYKIEVSDNGFGIPSDECIYVFDKYFRSANVEDKNIPGIGLGLCYVKLLVAAHKGTISLKSKLGEGSAFTIEIPKKQ
jgi:two-component system phosphate regulon sensor histidine kinase PhoR